MLNLFAQTYTYTTTTPDTNSAGLALFSGVWIVIWLAVAVLSIVAMWRMFVKAGQPGWAAIIPIYNAYVLLKVAGRPGWWLILLFIPVVNFVISIIVGIDVARKFGYGDVFGVILCGLLGIGYLIIGLGSAQYKGDAALVGEPTTPSQTPPAPTAPTGNMPPQV